MNDEKLRRRFQRVFKNALRSLSLFLKLPTSPPALSLAKHIYSAPLCKGSSLASDMIIFTDTNTVQIAHTLSAVKTEGLFATSLSACTNTSAIVNLNICYFNAQRPQTFACGSLCLKILCYCTSTIVIFSPATSTSASSAFFICAA